jgi:predicted peroxiredoxin
MGKTLGICVATRDYMQHVLGIAAAAHKAGHAIEIFFTGEGVHLTQDHRFGDLMQLARVSICEVSYIANGYHNKELQGLSDKDFVTQARNAEMVSECDRYLII